MSIENVDFGRLDAESETNLADYFVDTGVLKRLAAGERQFIIGRKGAGKTALFRQATSEVLKSTIVRLEFSDYAWETHKAVRELGLPAENGYTSSWLFTFLVAACDVWRRSDIPEISGEAERVYEQVYGKESVGPLNAIIDKLKRLRRLELPSAEGLGKLGAFELEELPEGATLARAANVWNQKLLALADQLFDKCPVSVLVDRLDDGWDASEEIRNMLAGAIKAARNLNLRVGRVGRARPVVIFLRSDILGELQFNDKNKISPDTEFLEWGEHSLIDVINVRIARSLDIDKGSAWNAVFSSSPMRQRASIRSYLVKRTMRRPRDIIAYSQFCKEEAVAQGHLKVETSDVYEAERRYSRHILDELSDEMHKQVPFHRELFKALRLIGRTRFTSDEWVNASTRIDATLGIHEAESRLKLLFEYAVVGVPKVGGRGGGSTFEFIYDDPLLDPDFEGEMVVHPALSKQLGLKEARPDLGDAPNTTPDGFDLET